MNITSTNQPAQVVLIEGVNFQGEIKLEETILKIQIVQFSKGEFFTTQITNSGINQNLQDYMGFENVRDLYKEIIVNKDMVFTKNNSLIVYCKLVYKDKPLKMKLQLPLTPKIFQAQKCKMQSLLKLIESMSLQKIKYKKYFPQLIDFKGDETNVNFKKFQVFKNNKQIKMLGVNQYVIFNHFDVMAGSGIFYYKVKIIKTLKKQIFLGICAKNIVQSINVKNSPDLIGLHLKGQYGVKVPNLVVQEGVSIFKVQINMDRKWVSWFLNDILLTTASIEQLAQKSIYPMISLHTSGDTIEILDK